MMPLVARFDPTADPWGTGMLACLVVCGFALLWWLVAVLMRQPARGSGRVMSLGLFGYLGCAVASTAIRVLTPPPAPPPAPTGPAILIEAKVPIDPDEDPKGAAAEAAARATKVEPAVLPGVTAPVEPAPVEPAPVEPAPVEPAVVEATPSAAPPAPVEAALPVEAAPPVEATPKAATPVPLGPPTLVAREALRFVDEVSHDADKCIDAKQVAAAARELAGALDGVPRSRVEKAAGKLEGCRRKIVWARTFTIRRNRVEDRERLAETLPKRLREQGIAVLVTLRGAAHERIRIGGATLDAAKAKALLDGGLRDELADAGFTEITLADMKTAVKETHAGQSDADLAAAELAPLGLERKLALP
jgi:hypothetical protein